jgi:hypothetical protein
MARFSEVTIEGSPELFQLSLPLFGRIVGYQGKAIPSGGLVFQPGDGMERPEIANASRKDAIGMKLSSTDLCWLLQQWCLQKAEQSQIPLLAWPEDALTSHLGAIDISSTHSEAGVQLRLVSSVGLVPMLPFLFR